VPSSGYVRPVTNRDPPDIAGYGRSGRGRGTAFSPAPDSVGELEISWVVAVVCGVVSLIKADPERSSSEESRA